MDAVKIEFAPETGTEEEWNEAYARLADYFRAHHLHNRIRRTQLILTTLGLAAEAHQKDASRSPTAHAIEQARHLTQKWLEDIYSNMNMTTSQIEAAGRLGFFLSSGPKRWPNFFLDRDDLPDDMRNAMRTALRESGPSMQISKMTPRDIDLGLISDVAEDGFDRFGKHPVVRYTALAIFIGAVLSYLFFLLR